MLKKEMNHHVEFNECNDKVFIYIVDMSTIVKDTIKFWNCLSSEEKLQTNQFYTKELIDRYIISHGILRCILSFYSGQRPKDIQFIYNGYGKPFMTHERIQFNMSHSHNMVCYIVAFDYQVGIDIELKNNSCDINNLLDLVLTNTEIKLFKNIESDSRIELFYNFWTKKESLVKAMHLMQDDYNAE